MKPKLKPKRSSHFSGGVESVTVNGDPIYRAPRNSRNVMRFCWMSDHQLAACAKVKGIPVPANNEKGTLTIAQRQKIMKALERKGWSFGDVTDLENVKLQRRKEDE